MPPVGRLAAATRALAPAPTPRPSAGAALAHAPILKHAPPPRAVYSNRGAGAGAGSRRGGPPHPPPPCRPARAPRRLTWLSDRSGFPTHLIPVP